MTTFSTPGPITATVEVAGARVRVTASDRRDTTVRVTPIDPGNRSHLKVADNTEVAFADGRLSVKTKTSGDRAGSIDIAIELPDGSALALFLAHSTVDAAGRLGECDVHLASGRVRFDRVARLVADLANGDLVLDRVDGSTTVNGATYDLRIGEAVGSVRVQGAGGTVRVDHAAADVEVSSGKCDVDIERADRNVTVETSSSTIRVGRMVHGDARVRNASGDIEIGVAEGSAVAVDARSDRGAVRDFVSAAAAPAGSTASRVSVHARTRHGDITVQRVAG